LLVRAGTFAKDLHLLAIFAMPEQDFGGILLGIKALEKHIFL
jgi:hypothetical protein